MQRKSITLSTEPYKGVRDFYPEDQFVQEHIFGVWKSVVERFGYASYNASILEPSELYKAKSGQEIVNEQTYTFIDRGEREVTIRPEMTPTVARLVAARKRDLGYPLRLYSIPNLFRYERPQRGRLREHWQLNVDIFGLQSVQAEIEIIEVASEILKALGAKSSDFQIKINSRKLLNSLFNDWYQLDEDKGNALSKLLDRKAKMPEETFYAEAEQIVGEPFKFLNFDEQSDELSRAMAMPNIKAAYDELKFAIDTLKSRGISNIEFDSGIIRGFDYYTGIVFEIFDTNPDNNRALLGGGRYDDLLSLFGEDNALPTCGFGMGDVTIRDFLEVRGLLPEYKGSANLMICIADEESVEYASGVAKKMREENIHVAVNYSQKGLGDQIKAAEKLHIPYVVVIGQTEAALDAYNIKRLSTGETIPVPNIEFVKQLVARV